MSANGNALVTWEQNGDIYARRFVAGAWDGATAIPLLENLAGAARNLAADSFQEHGRRMNSSRQD